MGCDYNWSQKGPEWESQKAALSAEVGEKDKSVSPPLSGLLSAG